VRSNKSACDTIAGHEGGDFLFVQSKRWRASEPDGCAAGDGMARLVGVADERIVIDEEGERVRGQEADPSTEHKVIA